MQKDISSKLTSFIFEIMKLMKDEAATSGIALTHFRILSLIEMGNLNNVSSLSEMLDLTKASVSIAVDGLQNEGLLEKQKSNEDKRYYKLSITKNGKTELIKITRKVRNKIKKRISVLNLREKKQFQSYLSKILNDND
ncbi:MAG: MarR family winged helix-turn-helix transcriptional regulator [Candidatus Dojkabacteria bacterium]|jgi:DNA-binding MarR family transcriptional regulator|nr:MarR family winged helix-turn-helix transcriptional regulator [Candidatus Dojkabacteria bacterium]